ncbi:MAG: thiamine pyrophosphate-dependent enzyme [Candidatus Berkelbacteria bacterium]
MDKIMPESWKESTKPHLFCPGCGHGIVMRHLGNVIDEMKISRDVTLGIDIGCSLLSWNLFNVDTIQTHHGRTTPTMVGYKQVKEDRIAIAYMGDGGGYAIGLQSMVHAAYRNNPITVIVVNNENYAMTGGQASPTSPVGMVTPTSPSGKSSEFGTGFHAPEMIAGIANKNAFIARGTVTNPIQMASLIKKAIECQKSGNFAMIEILSMCPTNWKTNAKQSFEMLKEMELLYPQGEFKTGKTEMEQK